MVSAHPKMANSPDIRPFLIYGLLFQHLHKRNAHRSGWRLDAKISRDGGGNAGDLHQFVGDEALHLGHMQSGDGIQVQVEVVGRRKTDLEVVRLNASAGLAVFHCLTHDG